MSLHGSPHPAGYPGRIAPTGHHLIAIAGRPGLRLRRFTYRTDRMAGV